jgi:hypothetical protein
VLALLPFDFCRLTAAFRFVRGEPMKVVRTGEPDDARDNDEVIARHFEKPMDEILNAVFWPIADRFAEAAALREERAEEADLGDRFTAGELLRHKWAHSRPGWSL